MIVHKKSGVALIVLMWILTIFAFLYTNKIFIIFLGCFGFISGLCCYTKYLILDRTNNKLSTYAGFFDDAIINPIKTIELDKFKKCCVSCKKEVDKSISGTSPIQYRTIYNIRMFTTKGIIEPGFESSEKAQIDDYANKIDEFMASGEERLVLKEDFSKNLRYVGYFLWIAANIIGITAGAFLAV